MSPPVSQFSLRREKNTTAERVSTGTASSDYIQLYHGDAKLLQESLEIVQRTATVILGAIRPEEVPV